VDALLRRLELAARFGKHPKRVVAVAAYEDAQTDARVNDFCQGLGRHLGEKCEIVKQMWLFSELRVPSLRTIAAGEAAQADMVIVSARHAQGFSEEVKDWIELWLGNKRKRPAVLLALFDPVYQGDSTSLQTHLKDAAKRGKMEFLLQTEEAPDKD
jgi:hypothetical protein